MTATREVTRFEFDMLRILRALFGVIPIDQVKSLIQNQRTPPTCLNPNASALVKDTLAKGLILHLVRAGGWRDESFLHNDRPTSGRVWNRVPLAERTLTFSRKPLDFLLWLTAEHPTQTKVEWHRASTESTAGDDLFFYVAYDALRDEPELFDALRSKSPFLNNPFSWLMNASDFATVDDPAPPSFAPLLSGKRAMMLECLQTPLTKRWLRSESVKSEIADWNLMRRRGIAETAILTQFLKAAEAANRHDLAIFPLKVLSKLFAGRSLEPSFWIGGLMAEAPMRLAERISIQRSALSLVQQADTFARWHQQARAVGYFDEGYAASQLWKEAYESLDGEATIAKARQTLAALDPLRVSAGGCETFP